MVGNSSVPDAAAEGERSGAALTAAGRAAAPPGPPGDGRLPDRIWTIPNVISIARLLGVPVFLWLVLGPHADGWAVILLIAAAASDWLDGKLARALHQESRLGQVLDPTADRLYIGVMLIGLAIRAIIPWWLVGVLVGRELVLARGPAPAAGPRLGAAPGQLRGQGRHAVPVLRVPAAAPGRLLRATPRRWPRSSAGRSWPGGPRCTGRRPGCTWSRPGGLPPGSRGRTAGWPNRDNRMANQVAALAGREPPVMMEAPCSNHGADPQADRGAGSMEEARTILKEARHR